MLQQSVETMNSLWQAFRFGAALMHVLMKRRLWKVRQRLAKSDSTMRSA